MSEIEEVEEVEVEELQDYSFSVFLRLNLDDHITCEVNYLTVVSALDDRGACNKFADGFNSDDLSDILAKAKEWSWLPDPRQTAGSAPAEMKRIKELVDSGYDVNEAQIARDGIDIEVFGPDEEEVMFDLELLG